MMEAEDQLIAEATTGLTMAENTLEDLCLDADELLERGNIEEAESYYEDALEVYSDALNMYVQLEQSKGDRKH